MTDDRYAHRRAGAAIKFTDPSGTPIADTDIAYDQVSHKFLFGCGAFDAGPATMDIDKVPANVPFSRDELIKMKEFSKDRVEKWLKLFNYGTLPFYWGRFEHEEGKPMTEASMAAAKYLTSRGARIKGHPLCWHTVCADWLLKYDNEPIIKKQLERINREVTDFRGVIDMWDVINEVVIMPVFDKYDNAITRICNELGRVKLVKLVFDKAKECNPDAVLLINDFNLSMKYHELIEECLDAGVPISAIGLQTHQHQGYMGRERLEEVLDRFSDFGLPLHFTENTLVSGHLMPPEIVDLNDYQVDEWPSTEEGEERQRLEWKEMYEILFGSPLVEAVTAWDFADGNWLKAPSGLIRKDSSLKPAYHELDRLINKEWTSSGVLHTDENGYARIEGYLGDYSFDLGGNKAVIKLTKDMSAENVVRLA